VEGCIFFGAEKEVLSAVLSVGSGAKWRHNGNQRQRWMRAGQRTFRKNPLGQVASELKFGPQKSAINQKCSENGPIS